MPFLARLASNWYELGAMLLEEIEEAQLNLIQDTHGVNKKKCCLAMLQYWMSTHPEATWHHLVTALRSPGVDLIAIASDIESKFTGKKFDMFYLIVIVYVYIAVYSYIHTYM